MTCSLDVRVGDIGTAFVLTMLDQDNVAVDLSSASTLNIIFTKPDGTKLTKTASLFSDGIDGKMQYISQSGDVDQVGSWKLQGYVVIGSNQWHSSIDKFRVSANL